MLSLLTTFHILTFATVLGGRTLLVPLLKKTIANGTNERLDELQDTISIARYSDFALIFAILSGLLLFFSHGISLTETHWSFKLKLVVFGLLIIDVGAYHIAQARIVNHYDSQMLPALQRLNFLAVLLMSGMVFFATFSA